MYHLVLPSYNVYYIHIYMYIYNLPVFCTAMKKKEKENRTVPVASI